MKSSYKKELALPEDIEFLVTWEKDNEVDMEAVNKFVDKLKRPRWYEDKKGHNPKKDTRMWMLEHKKFKTVEDPFTQKTMRIFLCENCFNGVSESGVDLGHKIDWKKHLKEAGVKTNEEARAAYNNLNNLILECRSCNVSHDWEEDSF